MSTFFLILNTKNREDMYVRSGDVGSIGAFIAPIKNDA